MSELLDLAHRVERYARSLGADEATATVSRSVHTSLARRDGKVEQATEATTKSLVFSVFADGKFSSHSTSDLRWDAVASFIKQGVEATHFLEPDPDQGLPDGALCGRELSPEQLDQLDPAYYKRTAEERASDAEQLERAIIERQPAGTLSVAVSIGDGISDTARVASNGFADSHEDAWFMTGGELTFLDGSRRPEAAAYYGVRYLNELPKGETIAAEVVERAKERIGSGPTASGSYPMILMNRSVGRLVGALGGPLSGASLHQNRSFLAGKKGERIGSELFTLLDDPTIPRGLASRPWDGDGLVARPLPIITNGVLNNYYVSVYYSRKLGVNPTTGGRSNWVIPAGDTSWQELAKAYPKAILVDGFLGGNSNGVTGDFSFGIRGLLLENGEITGSLSEMNMSGNLANIFDRLVAVADDPYRYSSLVAPTMVFDGVQFSGT